MIVIDGKIKGKARHRVVNGHAFTPKDTVEYENWVRLCYKQQCEKWLQGPIIAIMTAYYKKYPRDTLKNAYRLSERAKNTQ